MKKVLIITIGLLWLNLPVWAVNKLEVSLSDNAFERNFELSNEQEIAGLAMALNFANREDDVKLTSASFEGTRLEGLELKEALFDKIGRGTRLNSSHQLISYAVFCLKKKTLRRHARQGGIRSPGRPDVRRSGAV